MPPAGSGGGGQGTDRDGQSRREPVIGMWLLGYVRFAQMAELLRSRFEAQGSEGGFGSRRVEGPGWQPSAHGFLRKSRRSWSEAVIWVWLAQEWNNARSRAWCRVCTVGMSG